MVRPVLRERLDTNSDRRSSTLDLISNPRVSVQPVVSDTIATAGIVSPMLASAEPSARFRLV